MRRDGYLYIFTADYYGANYIDLGKDGKNYEIYMPSHRCIFDKFLETRKYYAYGDQYDYFEHPNYFSGPWNEVKTSKMGEDWQSIEAPYQKKKKVALKK